jgi:nucleotide-binding universal stress UspA family protein
MLPSYWRGGNPNLKNGDLIMNAQAIAFLQTMADRSDGILTPERVLAAAAPVDSPIHDFFTWDDDDAAYKQRLHEARSLIRRVKVEIKIGNVTMAVPYFVRDPARKANEQGYIAAPVLRTDEDAARDAVIEAFKRAAQALSSARQTAALLGLSDQIETLCREITSLSDSLLLPMERLT